jgi:hypothetical protein
MPLSKSIDSPSRKSTQRQKAKPERFLTVGTSLENYLHERPSIHMRGCWLADDESQRLELRVLETLATRGALSKAALYTALGKTEELERWRQVIHKLTMEQKIAYSVLAPMQGRSHFLTTLGCATLAARAKG